MPRKKKSPQPEPTPGSAPVPAPKKSAPITVKNPQWLPPEAVKRRAEYLKDSYEIERQWWRVIN